MALLLLCFSRWCLWLASPKVRCPAGNYCPAGTATKTGLPCPGGTWSDALGLADSSNCKPVPAGRYSVVASTNPQGTGPCAKVRKTLVSSELSLLSAKTVSRLLLEPCPDVGTFSDGCCVCVGILLSGGFFKSSQRRLSNGVRSERLETLHSGVNDVVFVRPLYQTPLHSPRL